MNLNSVQRFLQRWCTMRLPGGLFLVVGGVRLLSLSREFDDLPFQPLVAVLAFPMACVGFPAGVLLLFLAWRYARQMKAMQVAMMGKQRH
jgi:hypothetical protein